MRVLVTGAAGFIGFHVARKLLARGDSVVGLDNLNDYYCIDLKERRLGLLTAHQNFEFVRGDLTDAPLVSGVFSSCKPDRVIHLAAQAGVRYSIQNPRAFIDSNVLGFLNILEECRRWSAQHLVYASTSSVYGLGRALPFSESDPANHPISLYAATKKSNEMMAHSYSHLFHLPTTGLRFFTVYGPWGRPDMAPFLFAAAIFEGRPIDIFNYGNMIRDFTYIDDIAEGVVRVLDRVPSGNPSWDGRIPDSATSSAPFRIYNIGNDRPVELAEFIGAIESAIGRQAKKNLLPSQPGDVPATQADVSALMNDVGFRPSTSVAFGVQKFIEWYRDYNKIP